MSTAPWSPTAPAALTESLFHEVAGVIAPTNGEPITLEGVSGTVTFDEGWAPHVQATLKCKVPAEQATLDRIDPRAGARVVVSAGYVYPGGRRDVHELADLALRARPVSRPDNLMDLDAGSDEYRLQDTTPLGAAYVLGAPTLVRDAITTLIGYLLDTPTIVNAATSTATLGEPLTVSTGTNMWATVVDLADRINAWVYVDAHRVWQVADRAVLAGRTDYTLEVGPVGTITESTADLNVDEWGNAVLLTYPDDSFVYAQADTGPFAVGTVPTKVVTVRSAASGGPIGAKQDVAQALLRRVLSRGRGFTLTAPAAYWLRPGMTITAQLPTGPQERHLVARVTFDLPVGRMTVRTRVPDNDTTITAGA